MSVSADPSASPPPGTLSCYGRTRRPAVRLFVEGYLSFNLPALAAQPAGFLGQVPVQKPGRRRQVKGRSNDRGEIQGSPRKLGCVRDASHPRAGQRRLNDDGPHIIEETRKYIRDFDREVGAATSARDLFDRMMNLYPDRENPGAVWSSARALKG